MARIPKASFETKHKPICIWSPSGKLHRGVGLEAGLEEGMHWLEAGGGWWWWWCRGEKRLFRHRVVWSQGSSSLRLPGSRLDRDRGPWDHLRPALLPLKESLSWSSVLGVGWGWAASDLGVSLEEDNFPAEAPCKVTPTPSYRQYLSPTKKYVFFFSLSKRAASIFPTVAGKPRVRMPFG